MDFSGAFKGLAIIFYSSLIFIPLGIWKLIELIIWTIKHINISIN